MTNRRLLTLLLAGLVLYAFGPYFSDHGRRWEMRMSAKQTVTVLFWAGLLTVVYAATDTSYPSALILAGFALMLPAPTLGLLHAANHSRKAPQ